MKYVHLNLYQKSHFSTKERKQFLNFVKSKKSYTIQYNKVPRKTLYEC